jgi:hypothetical protein
MHATKQVPRAGRDEERAQHSTQKASKATSNPRVGTEFLTRRSWLIKHSGNATLISDAVIVDDSSLDTDRLATALRMVLGRDTSIRSGKTIEDMVALMRNGHPDLLLIDDNLNQLQKAETTLSRARAVGYHGPVIILSGLLTRQRVIQLARLEPIDIIHKDDLDSSRLREAMLKFI